MKNALIPYYKQETDYYCGPAVMQMILASQGIRRTQSTLAKRSKTTEKYGTPNKNLLRTMAWYGFSVIEIFHGTLKGLKNLLKQNIPVIVNYQELVDNEYHFAVLVDITPTSVVLHDPIIKKNYRLEKTKFLRRWKGGEPGYIRWAAGFIKK